VICPLSAQDEAGTRKKKLIIPGQKNSSLEQNLKLFNSSKLKQLNLGRMKLNLWTGLVLDSSLDNYQNSNPTIYQFFFNDF